MPEIYVSAEKVCAWLGQGDADCLYAFKYAKLRSLGRANLATVDPKLLIQYFEQLFLQSYWSRTWTIQEAVLAKQLWLLCRTEMILWDDLAAAFDHHLDSCTPLSFPHNASRKINFWDDTEADEETESRSRFSRLKWASDSLINKKYNLLELAERFRHYNCTDPRDKLYGPRGIASDGKYFRVDYDQATPYVFLRALSLDIPLITQWGPGSYSEHSRKIEYATTLCTSIPIPKVDIVAMLRDTKTHSLLEWMSYSGEVLSCEPVCLTLGRPGYDRHQYWEILVHGGAVAYYITTQDVQPEDKIYHLTNGPGEGDEESDEYVRLFVVAFWNSNADTTAVDKLMTIHQMHTSSKCSNKLRSTCFRGSIEA